MVSWILDDRSEVTYERLKRMHLADGVNNLVKLSEEKISCVVSLQCFLLWDRVPLF